MEVAAIKDYLLSIGCTRVDNDFYTIEDRQGTITFFVYHKAISISVRPKGASRDINVVEQLFTDRITDFNEMLLDYAVTSNMAVNKDSSFLF